MSRFVLARNEAIPWLEATSLLNPCIQTLHWQGGGPIACWSRRPTEMTQGLVSLSCPSFFPRCLSSACVYIFACSSVFDGICGVFKLSCASTHLFMLFQHASADGRCKMRQVTRVRSLPTRSHRRRSIRRRARAALSLSSLSRSLSCSFSRAHTCKLFDALYRITSLDLSQNLSVWREWNLIEKR